MTVFIIVRITDTNGDPDFETMAAFSTFDHADRQAKILRPIYDVEVHELQLDQYVMLPEGKVTVSNG